MIDNIYNKRLKYGKYIDEGRCLYEEVQEGHNNIFRRVIGFFSTLQNTNAEASKYENKVSGGSWIKDSSSGKWWYKHMDGSYTVNDWEFIDGKWYWFDEYGWMQTGWKYINKKWYWFGNDDSGYMRQGWERINGIYYWFDESGAMVTGHKRISDIDYYFDASGALTDDASLIAAIYTKDYGGFDINTLSDGKIVASLLKDYYKIEQHDNFVKSSFTYTNNIFKTNNLNKGIFYYSGHGLNGGYGISLGGGSYISPSELKGMEMNNTKVAFFFACYCGLPDNTGDSMATAAIKAGAKASFAYKTSSTVVGDQYVSELIFKRMMKGETLEEAVDAVRKRYGNYKPITKENLIVEGNKRIRISDTYAIKGGEEFIIPEGYTYKNDGSTIELYILEYNGYQTTDKIVYDKKNKEIVFKRSRINPNRLGEIDFAKVKKNSEMFDTNYSNKQYQDHFDVITMIENNPTVVRVCSYITNGLLEYNCIDMQNNQDITKKVNLFEDIM